MISETDDDTSDNNGGDVLDAKVAALESELIIIHEEEESMDDAVISARYAEDIDVGVVSPVKKPVSLCESTIVCDASPMPTASKELVDAWLELFSCAGAGNLTRVDELLEAGRNAKMPTLHGNAAMLIAANVLLCLLPSYMMGWVQGCTVLQYVIRFEDIPYMKSLINRRADVNHRTRV
jgi:hypothetical protein